MAMTTHARGAKGATPPGKGHVRVCVRLRPLMTHEIATGNDIVIRSGSDGRSLQAVISRVGDKETLRQYEFDRVCGPDASQPEFFQVCGVKNLIDNALQGVNVSVLAYGQTGSGKTFSMSGHEERILARTFGASDEAAGVIPRAVEYLYAKLADQPSDTRTTVRASYCEIYNEMIYDLLNLTGESLPLRWNSSLGFFVQGQLVVQCDTVDDVMAVVTEGHKNRTVGSHALNVDSSRSHSLLALHIERVTTDHATKDSVTRRSKVIFVDLAGSERLKESKSEGLTAIETRQINKSLFVLGKVIAALSDKKHAAGAGRSSPVNAPSLSALRARPPGLRSHSPTRGTRPIASWDGDGPATDPHVPYRDSKLTKLLTDSLGGNALTLMIACASPASSYLEETLNTLQYAMRASKIENAPVIQIDTKDAMILALRKETKLLRQEIDVLRSFIGIPPEMPFEEMALMLQSPPPPHASSRALMGPPAVGEPTGYDAPAPERHKEAPRPPLKLHVPGKPAEASAFERMAAPVNMKQASPHGAIPPGAESSGVRPRDPGQVSSLGGATVAAVQSGRMRRTKSGRAAYGEKLDDARTSPDMGVGIPMSSLQPAVAAGEPGMREYGRGGLQARTAPHAFSSMPAGALQEPAYTVSQSGPVFNGPSPGMSEPRAVLSASESRAGSLDANARKVPTPKAEMTAPDGTGPTPPSAGYTSAATRRAERLAQSRATANNLAMLNDKHLSPAAFAAAAIILSPEGRGRGDHSFNM